MNDGKLFEKYYARVKRESLIKSAVCAVIVGFAVNFLTAFIAWMVYSKIFWLSIVLGVAAIAAFVPIFYYKKFRPTTKDVARRIDRLGLEERIITMTELEKDESYIAMRQREDAKRKLGAVDAKQIRFRFSTAAAVVAAICAVLGVSMTTVTTLSAQGALPGGGEFINSIKPEEPPVYLSVSYLASEGGYIEGEAEQIVAEGEDSASVAATAEEGWRFERWSDGVAEASRTDKNVQKEFVVTARFVRVEESLPAEEEGDFPDDVPAENQPSSPGAGGEYIDYNQVLDGETHYRTVYEEYYKWVMEQLSSDGKLTPEQREMIEAYFDLLL